MFTGLFPTGHGVHIEKDIFSPALPFLPSILKKNGYKTTFLMPKHAVHLPIDTVYNRGIDEILEEYDVPWVTALTEFEKNVSSGVKSFLFLHTYYAHEPYFIEDRSKLYTDDTIDKVVLKTSDWKEISDHFVTFLINQLRIDLENKVYGDEKKDIYENLLQSLSSSSDNIRKQKNLITESLSLLSQYFENFQYFNRIDKHNPREVAYLRALYDQKIQELDAGPIQELISFISRSSLKDNTIVIVTADHGEEFMEHGYLSHSTLYDSNSHVPLIIRVPGLSKGSVHSYVQTADITPTILDLIGVPKTDIFQGKSLKNILLGEKIQPRIQVAVDAYQTTKTLRFGKWKLFLNTQQNPPVPVELYDTVADPGETNNLLYISFDVAQDIMEKHNNEEREWNN